MPWESLDNQIYVPGRIIASAGFISGMTFGTKFGRNTDVDAAEDVVSMGGDYQGQPVTVDGDVLGVEETFQVLSTDANDTALGSGAREITFECLSAEGDLVQDVLALNGTTPVNSAFSGIRSFRAFISKFGSSGTNEGTVDVRHTPSTSRIFAEILPGAGQSEVAVYTVPKGFVGVFFDAEIKVDGNANAVVDVSFRVRENGQNGYVRKNILRGTSSFQPPPDNAIFSVPELTDVKLRIESVSSANTDVAAQFNFAILKR